MDPRQAMLRMLLGGQRPGVEPPGGREPQWGSPNSGKEWTMGAPETYAHWADPDPRRGTTQPGQRGNYGRSNPKSKRSAEIYAQLYADWLEREERRQRQAEITQEKLAGTTMRGNANHGGYIKYGVGQMKSQPTRTLFFDDESRLVATRSPMIPNLRVVPGSNPPVMESNPAWEQSRRPDGNLVMYETPRKLTVNPRIR